MRRREFITFVGCAAATWPLAAQAQQQTATMHRLSLLFATSEQAAKARGLLEAVTQGLKEYGWVEGQNITIEYRFADGKADALPRLAVEVVQLRVDAIVTDSTPATQAAKNATRTVPIVAIINDPVASGFIVNLARPGGNITGVSLQSAELAGRRIQLLTELVPGLARVAILSNPANQSHAGLVKQSQAAAQSLGIKIDVAGAPAPDSLENAFAAITAVRVGALIVCRTRCSLVNTLVSWRSRRRPTCRRSFRRSSPSRPAASWPTVRASRPVFGKRAPMWIKFCAAPIRPICRSSSQRRSSS